MAARIKPSRKNRSAKVFYWASVVCAILGTLDALYLYTYKLTSNNKMCLGSGGCETINYSIYSEIYGIPVSLLGMLTYLVILGVLLLEPRWKLARENGPLVVFGLSLAGVSFSGYLTYIASAVIEATCPFCVASAVIITLIFILAIIRLVKQTTL